MNPHKSSKVLRIFKVADVDGSGALSKEEVGKYLCRQERGASQLVGDVELSGNM